jgi:hypothetical protein
MADAGLDKDDLFQSFATTYFSHNSFLTLKYNNIMIGFKVLFCQRLDSVNYKL